MTAVLDRDTAAYDRHRKRTGERQRKQTLSGQQVEIGDVQNRRRRNRCLASFKAFCETYGKAEFPLKWADFHLRAIEKIQAAVLRDEWYAFAMPRGSGKTTLSEWGVIWSVLGGKRDYVLFIGASQTLAERQLQTIKTTLSTNDLLQADFPHALDPIVALENETRRAKGQRNKADGKHTLVEWGPNRIILPQIDHKDSLCSGSVIEAYGLETAKRGIKYKRRDGTTIRPSLVIADDPQTRESAASPTQTHTRLKNLTGDVAYLNGPAKPISIVVPCTVIERDDLADQILDREKHPEWHGERTEMVKAFPEDMELWDEYADLLRAGLREDEGTAAATEFYRKNRSAMDLGSEVTWPERKLASELSPIQHAMNLKIRDDAAFWAECQNQPKEVINADLVMRSVDGITRHQTGHERGTIPPEVTVLTAFADVQKEHLFWMLCGWTPEFTGFVIDYGAWPGQGRHYFKRSEVRQTLSQHYGTDDEGHQRDDAAVVFAALCELGDLICEPRELGDGRAIEVERWGIDIGWDERKPSVQSFRAQSEYRNRICLTYGFGVKARERPFSASPRLIEQKTGPAWYWTRGRSAGEVTFDTNFWKTRAHEGLASPLMGRGSVQLFKASPHEHRMLAEHLHAEKPIRVDAKGRTVYEWDDSARRDNEGLDCLVGNMVMASVAGVTKEAERRPKRKEKPRSMQERRAAAMAK